MQPYSFTICLKVRHPNINPEIISQALGLKPIHSWQSGKPRMTPKGTLLNGHNKESYWYTDPFDRGECFSSDYRAEDLIVEILEYLEPKKEFLKMIHSENGRVSVEINTFSTRNYTIELPPEVMARFSSIGLSVVLDVYPYKQNW